MRKLSSKKSTFSGILTTRALGAPAHATKFNVLNVPPVHPKVNPFTVDVIGRDIAGRIGGPINCGISGNLPNDGAGYAVLKNGTGCTASGAGTITGTVG